MACKHFLILTVGSRMESQLQKKIHKNRTIYPFRRWCTNSGPMVPNESENLRYKNFAPSLSQANSTVLPAHKNVEENRLLLRRFHFAAGISYFLDNGCPTPSWHGPMLFYYMRTWRRNIGNEDSMERFLKMGITRQCGVTGVLKKYSCELSLQFILFIVFCHCTYDRLKDNIWDSYDFYDYINSMKDFTGHAGCPGRV